MSTTTSTREGTASDVARTALAATTGSRLPRLGLAAGWVALAAAVLVAHRNPATGYELSIYRATPTGFWVGVGAAMLVALLVSWRAGIPRRLRLTALGLAGSAGFSVAALPVLRGYYHVGSGDALTHLGWTADVVAGRLAPAEFLYPALHSTAAFVAGATGVDLALAVQYVVLAFVGCYLVFVPLTARAVAGTDRALVAGTFAAVMLLPVNNVSAHLMAHPTTQAVLFLPVALYVLVRYVTTPEPPSGPGGRSAVARTARRFVPTRWGALLALLSVGVLLVHPQVALTLLAGYAAIAALQAYARRAWPGGRESTHRSMGAQTLVLAAAFALWAPRNPRVQGAIDGVLENLFGGAVVADEVAQRGGSLAALGSSLPELFLKLFGPTVVLGLLAAGLALAALLGRLGGDPERAALVRYLAAVAVPGVAGFALFFGVSVSTQAFRYVAFVACVVTVLGAVALAAGADRLGRRGVAPAGRAAAVVCLAVLLPLATMTVFASPFVYQPSPGVTQQEVDGYRAAFATQAPDVPFVGVRSGPVRYVHAVFGTTPVDSGAVAVPGQTAGLPDAAFGPGLTDRYDVARYVPVVDRDYEREVVLYRGFRYDPAGFETLRTAPGVDRVRSNGDFRLYLVADASA